MSLDEFKAHAHEIKKNSIVDSKNAEKMKSSVRFSDARSAVKAYYICREKKSIQLKIGLPHSVL